MNLNSQNWTRVYPLFCLGWCIVLVCGLSASAQEELPAPQPAIQNGPLPEFDSNEGQTFSVSIGDLTTVAGVRTNKLTGMGLVVGLNNTGGTNPDTRQYALNMLERFGPRADPLLRQSIRTNTQTKTSNLSVVVVTAELPAFASAGSKINAIVSTFDDAKSLQGGTLIITPLYGFDDEVYAVANGNIKLGGLSATGQAASVTVNHPTVGLIPGGATVEKEVCDQTFARDGVINLLLREPSFENVRRISDAINTSMPGVAQAADPGTVRIIVPPQIPRNNLALYQQHVMKFVAEVQSLRYVPYVPARVVINERTGTVVIGENVRISRVIFSHANLSVITGESPQVVQPNPFSQGETTVVPRTDIEVNQGKDVFRVIEQPVTVGELARALNALGATPRDLSAILTSMSSAGALHAEVISE
jgi:flagellar P-ring protein precursor FlgI